MKETAIKQAVREHYTRAAEGDCCGAGSACCGDGAEGQQETAPRVPSFGCGSPVEVADLHGGETVLDLGSGRGLDVFRAAQRVGTAGRVIGVDMTPEMVWRAREDARRLGFTDVEFRLGEIEALPLPDASADVVVSNCVINLIPDKDRAFAEAFRVLRAGGRLVVADMVRTHPRAAGPADDLPRWAACIDGADEEGVYLQRLRRVGFTAVEVLDRGSGEIHHLTVRARKPESAGH